MLFSQLIAFTNRTTGHIQFQGTVMVSGSISLERVSSAAIIEEGGSKTRQWEDLVLQR
jgi:hypothetical protein